MRARLTQAISQGAPLYNAGSHDGCAQLYAATALDLLTEGAFSDLSSLELNDALSADHATPSDRAWALRRAFDRALGDAAFAPRIEAPLPAGVPGPGPVGAVVEKAYPATRAARCRGAGAFGALFRHISGAGISMTSPVLAALSEGAQPARLDMAFFYGAPARGAPGPAGGGVEVVDLPPLRVLSVCVRGVAEGPALSLAQRCVETGLAARGLARSGPWRLLSYNSPMVPAELCTFELQAPLA